MTRAGTPPTSVFDSIDFVTTDPAATTHPEPIVTPGRIVLRVPSHEPEPTWIALLYCNPARLSAGPMSCVLVTNATPGAIETPSPMMMSVDRSKVQSALIQQSLPMVNRVAARPTSTQPLLTCTDPPIVVPLPMRTPATRNTVVRSRLPTRGGSAPHSTVASHSRPSS